MSEFPRDESDLERRLQAHYQHRYGQVPDAALIWARVQPKLEQQTADRSTLLRQVRQLPLVLARLAARQRAALKERYKEQTFMDETIHPEQARTNHRPIVPGISSPRRRFKCLVEMGLAAVLLASLLFGWFAVTHLYNRPGSAASFLTSYTGNPGETIGNLAWAPDGHSLTFMACKTVPQETTCALRVWNTVTEKVRQTRTFTIDHTKGIGWFADSSRSYILLMAWNVKTNIGSITLLNILTGQTTQIEQEHAIMPQGEAFSHDSKSLAIFDGKNIQVWDTATGRLRLATDPASIPEGAQANDSPWILEVGWSADDKRVSLSLNPAFMDGLQVWDAHTGHRLAMISGGKPGVYPTYYSLSPDMKRVLIYNEQNETFTMHDVSTMRVLQTFSGQLDLSSRDRVIPTWLDGGTRLLLQDNQQAFIWDTTTGQRMASCSLASGEEFSTFSIAGVSTDGEERYFGCLQQNNQLAILDVRTGTQVKKFPLAKQSQGYVWLSDKYLFMQDKGNADGHIYDTQAGQLILYLRDVGAISFNGADLAVVFSPPYLRFNPRTTITVRVFALH